MLKSNDKILLFVAHQIHLTSEERQALINEKTVNTIGVSIPVWVYNKKTSEPPKEIFCKYNLIVGESSNIHTLQDGYKIVLPKIPIGWKKPELNNEIWRKMSNIEKDKWYNENRKPFSVQDLQDPPNGGKFYFKKMIKTGKYFQTNVTVEHTVIITDIKFLEESLT